MREVIQLVGTVREASGLGCIQGRLRRRRTESNVGKAAVDVPRIVKNSATGAAADERQAHRKLQLLVEDEHAQSAHRETGHRIAGSGLVEPEAAQGGAAAGEETLR